VARAFWAATAPTRVMNNIRHFDVSKKWAVFISAAVASGA
jgi:hypothetical protein